MYHHIGIEGSFVTSGILVNESQRIWSSNGLTVRQLRWDMGEPDNRTGNELCIMFKKYLNNIAWHDIPCTLSWFQVICENDPPS